jgi:hypothetical protein
LAQPTASTSASKEAAAAAAATAVLLGFHSLDEGEIKAALSAYIGAIPNGEARSDGVRIGEAAAARVLETRANDGSEAPDAYRPKTKPGVYVATPVTVGSVWPKLMPFAMTSPSSVLNHHST